MHMLILHIEKSQKRPEQLPVPPHQHDPSNSSVLALITRTLQGGILTWGDLGHAGDTTSVEHNSVPERSWSVQGELQGLVSHIASTWECRGTAMATTQQFQVKRENWRHRKWPGQTDLFFYLYQNISNKQNYNDYTNTSLHSSWPPAFFQMLPSQKSELFLPEKVNKPSLPYDKPGAELGTYC